MMTTRSTYLPVMLMPRRIARKGIRLCVTLHACILFGTNLLASRFRSRCPDQRNDGEKKSENEQTHFGHATFIERITRDYTRWQHEEQQNDFQSLHEHGGISANPKVVTRSEGYGLATLRAGSSGQPTRGFAIIEVNSNAPSESGHFHRFQFITVKQ